MAKKETLHNQILDRQRSIESDLKRELDVAHNKLTSARLGFKAESEMYQDSLERFAQQEWLVFTESESSPNRKRLLCPLDNNNEANTT